MVLCCLQLPELLLTPFFPSSRGSSFFFFFFFVSPFLHLRSLMRSETNNAWAEGSGDDPPRRPSGSDIGQFTDNSQSGSQQQQTRSHSRDGSGGRLAAAVPRSSCSQRCSGLHVPDASPPPRLPEKYAAQMKAAAVATGRGGGATREAPVTAAQVGVGTTVSGVVDEDDEEGQESEEEWEDSEEGEWEDEEDEDEDEGEEEEEQESQSGGGGRALMLDFDSSREVSAQPVAEAASASPPAATTAANLLLETTTAEKVTQPKEIFGSAPFKNAFRRATPVARTGYSAGYTPAEGQSSEETPKASPPRAPDTAAAVVKATATPFGRLAASNSAASAPNSDVNPFSTTLAMTNGAASNTTVVPPASPLVAKAAARPNPFQHATTFPTTAAPAAPPATGTCTIATEVPVKTSPAAYSFGPFPSTSTQVAGPVPSTASTAMAGTEPNKVNPFPLNRPAEGVKPAITGVTTSGLPFQRTSYCAEPAAAATGAAPAAVTATTISTTSTSNNNSSSSNAFGTPFLSFGAVASKAASNPSLPSDVDNTLAGVSVNAAFTPGPQQKPFCFPTPQTMKSAFGVPAAAGGLGSGPASTTTARAPAGAASNPFADPLESRIFASTERKPHLYPPTASDASALKPPPFAGFGLPSVPGPTKPIDAVGDRNTKTAAASTQGIAPPPPAAAASAPLFAAKTTDNAPLGLPLHVMGRTTTIMTLREPAAQEEKKSLLPIGNASATSCVFTSLAHNATTSSALKSQQDRPALRRFSGTQEVDSTTSSPRSPQRPTVGAVEARPLSSSQQSSSVDYSTMVASPMFGRDDDEDEDEENGAEGGEKEEGDDDVMEDVLASAAVGDATAAGQAWTSRVVFSTDAAATAVPAAESESHHAAVTETTAAFTANVHHQLKSSSEPVATGRSKTVKHILAAISDASTARDIVNAACEREEDRTRPVSDMSSPSASPTGALSAVVAAAPLQDRSCAHGTPLENNATATTLMAAEKPAMVFSAEPIRRLAHPPVTVKVTIRHVYNYSQEDGEWMADPDPKQHKKTVSAVPAASAATPPAPPSSSSSPSLRVALYCRPLLVHLPNPSLRASLLRAVGESGPWRQTANAAWLIFASLLPAFLRVLLHLAVEIGMIVLCILVVDGVWSEYPLLREWTRETMGHVQNSLSRTTRDIIASVMVDGHWRTSRDHQNSSILLLL